MNMLTDTSLASEQPVQVSSQDMQQMLAFARTVFHLKSNRSYVTQLSASLPDTAHLNTGYASILMGYDFHLTAEGPRLIEINNNAGGLFIGNGRWLPQLNEAGESEELAERLLSMFPNHWQTIAIMDADIEQQFMYPEMQAYAELLRGQGRIVFLVSPEQIHADPTGLYCEGKRLDAIYNRHTDFYLQSEALRPIHEAYMTGQVELNPHPRSYALIGDKARMVNWWKPGWLEEVADSSDIELIRQVTPETHHLRDMDEETLWQDRNNWVLKPAARHGGKGVVLGRSVSRKRFYDMDRADTIAQWFVAPSMVEINEQEMKLDIRLYMHGEKLIALAGRVWRGQVTNFREAGSGWVSIQVV